MSGQQDLSGHGAASGSGVVSPIGMAVTYIRHARPASHYWAMVFAGFLTFALVGIHIREFANNQEFVIWKHPIAAFLILLAPIALAALIFGGTRKAAYLITVCCLGAWAARAIQFIVYFVMALWTKPEFVDGIGSTYAYGSPILAALIIWLFVRFAFGAPSRNYFGFRPSDSVKA